MGRGQMGCGAARRLGAFVVLASAGFASACGDDLPRDEICGPQRPNAGFDLDSPFCERLSTYSLFADTAKQQPAEGVLPYTVRTQLFADHAGKDRFIVLPGGGGAMSWRDREAFDLPVGSVLVKTFSFPRDARDASRPRQLLETRLLVHRQRGWEGAAYVYDRNGEAKLAVEGAELPVDWIDETGAARHQQYLVPNKNQCKNCHEEAEGTLTPLGPKARHLNGPGPAVAGDDGVIANQLQHWIDVGALTGAPAKAEWPQSAVAFDASSGTLEQRARTWLDVSCSHCHNPRGAARTSGLDLSLSATPAALGICKAPVATGRGSAGRQFDIVPGKPDESIIMARLESSEPEIKMPELGRTLVDEQGVKLIREWISAMPGNCSGM